MSLPGVGQAAQCRRRHLSILLSGGLTLMVLGLSVASVLDMKTGIRRRAIVGIVIGTLFVAVPLSVSSFRIAQESHLEHQAQKIAKKWLDQSNFDLIKLDALKDRLEIVITGSGATPSISELGEALRGEIEKDTTIRLRVIPSQVEYYPQKIAE